MKPLLDAEFMRKLETLSLFSRRISRGRMKGERRSPKKGASVEFADFRNYVQGDDFRHIDWNAYARMENLFLKLFLEEEDLAVHIFIDSSRSMSFGEPVTKFDLARRLAAALAYIALSNLDSVSISFVDDRFRSVMPLTQGKGRLFRVFRFLEDAATTDGVTDIVKTFRLFRFQGRRRGLLVIISDFLSVSPFEDDLKVLASMKFDPVLIQVLSPDELEPQPGGDWRLQDSETGRTIEVSLTPRVAREFSRKIGAYCGYLDSLCRSHGISYYLARTDADFEDLVLKYLRESRVVV